MGNCITQWACVCTPAPASRKLSARNKSKICPFYAVWARFSLSTPVLFFCRVVFPGAAAGLLYVPKVLTSSNPQFSARQQNKGLKTCILIQTPVVRRRIIIMTSVSLPRHFFRTRMLQSQIPKLKRAPIQELHPEHNSLPDSSNTET